VAAAGGVAVLLPAVVGLAEEHARLCDAFVLTGGGDPRTEEFGAATHPRAEPVHPERQAYEVALLRVLARERRGAPVLGVCLGMQMMALQAGGRLDQHLPETLATADRHAGGLHAVVPVAGTDGPVRLARGEVASRHRQAVADPGALRTIAVSEDGVIEAVADPTRAFYVGVQWHPERTADPVLGRGVFEALVRAAVEAGARPG